MADLTFQVAPISGLDATARVAMSGAIDASTVINFQNKLEQMKGEGTRRFLLDMEGIRYVNSTGLGSLVKLADQLENEGGAIVLMKIHPKVKVVFDMLGLNAFFRIFNSDSEAVDHLQTLPPVGAAAAPAPEPEPEPLPPAPAPAPAPAARPAPAPAAAPAAVASASEVGCASCGVTLRVSAAGGYRCPRCLAPFRLESNGSTTTVAERGSAPIHLTLNGSSGCADGLRQFVASVARDAGLSGAASRAIEGAVETVARAIVSHAYGNDATRPFSVFLAPGSGELGVTFSDTGERFNGNDSVLDGARGQMDAFDVQAHPRGGNVVSMRKSG